MQVWHEARPTGQAGGEDEWALQLPPLTLVVLMTLDELLKAPSGI